MGLSHAAAAGVLFFAAVLAGFQVSDKAFDGQDELVGAWNEFHDTNAARAATSFTIDDVKKFGAARTEVTLTNTGSTTIHAADMTLLYDGTHEPVTGWSVDAQPSAVWAPGSQLILVTAALTPQDVVAMDGIGVKAYWRK